MSVKKLNSLFYEKEEAENGDNKSILTVLNNIINKNIYRLCVMNSDDYLIEVENTEKAEDFIKKIISPMLLEAAIVYKKNWVFITQFEAYYRNNAEIDGSSVPTLLDRYSVNPIGKIKNKTERGNSWFELSVFFGQFELLLTGGFCGSMSSNNIVPFLGPNIPFVELVNDDPNSSDKFYMLENNQDMIAHYQVRNLRNWTKLSSSLEWTCISYKFFKKDFATLNPHCIQTSSPIIAITSIIVIKHISKQKSFNDEELDHLLKQLPIFKNLKNMDRIKSFMTIRKKIIELKGSQDLVNS